MGNGRSPHAVGTNFSGLLVLDSHGRAVGAALRGLRRTKTLPWLPRAVWSERDRRLAAIPATCFAADAAHEGSQFDRPGCAAP
jgi:hypothetical protein